MTKKLVVDFDGTLCCTAWPKVGKRKLIHKLIAAYVRRKHSKDWVVIINTLREHGNGTLDAALMAMGEWEIPWDYVNENYPPDNKKYGLDARKIGATLNIDDKNIGFIGWLLRRIDDGQ